jgi:hypothetical protein
MRLAFLVPFLGLALSACCCSSGGGSSPPSRTYIVMPSGQTTPCGPGTNTACPVTSPSTTRQ